MWEKNIIIDKESIKIAFAKLESSGILGMLTTTRFSVVHYPVLKTW
jgi:hypothetical protein